MGNLELCSPMDQHESMHSNIYAGQFIDRWRYELVAGHPYYLSWQHHCFNSNDIERACRRKIWYTLPCFCESQFWNEGSQYSCHIESNCCLRMVWHSDMDRRCCHIQYFTGLEPFTT